ncbi:MAG: S-layer homology domain-containing protein [Clostridia bacterium]|nr:S-layer homology domain-containing protein [Clostridia bacterium]
MRKNLMRLFAFVILFVSFVFTQNDDVYAKNMVDFVDVENHWAKESIEELVNRNIISGYGDGTFRPENNVTVAEFLKMIVEAGEYPLVRSGDSVWPDFYIETAVSKKIILRDDFENYDRAITRYEIANVVSKFVDTSDVRENKNIFKDLDNEYKSEVLKLVKLKIINGYEDKTYRGKNNVTRAEAATIICKTLNARDELISERDYDVAKRIDLTNYRVLNDPNKSSIKTYYEIKGNDLLIYDHGRYAKLDGYEVNDKNVEVKKVIKIIKTLVSENRYVAVVYVPSKYTINQLRILYGKSEINTLSNEYDFSFTYYEDKPYELSRISGVEEFSDECYLKIDVLKMWDDFYDYQSGIYVDEYKKEKLAEALEVEFGGYANLICEYILEKNIKFVTNVERDIKHVEQKKFGNYIINFYQPEGSVPQFYVAKQK